MPARMPSYSALWDVAWQLAPGERTTLHQLRCIHYESTDRPFKSPYTLHTVERVRGGSKTKASAEVAQRPPSSTRRASSVHLHDSVDVHASNWSCHHQAQNIRRRVRTCIDRPSVHCRAHHGQLTGNSTPRWMRSTYSLARRQWIPPNLAVCQELSVWS